MIVERELGVDVVTAARQRIRNIFSNGLPVYLSFSGGKDSLVLAHLVFTMCAKGELDISRLRVVFIDEEAIFPCVEEIVRKWRDRFLLAGAQFDWYCLEVRHFNCLNQLESDESFICWDSTKEQVWVREPPPFAIRSHPLLRPRKDNYQQWFARIHDGPNMTGVRAFESIQRRVAVASQQRTGDLSRNTVEPCYDWQDNDVWKYLRDHHIEIPQAYMFMYQLGCSKKQMRISQFFSIDTAYILSRISEFYPGLMERILKREPSAYIVSLYWDSEMFRRRSRNRREAEAQVAAGGESARTKVLRMLSDIDRHFGSKVARETARNYQRLVLSRPYIEERHFQKMYDALVAGDPKRRSLRAIYADVERAAADRFVPGNATFAIDAQGQVRGNHPSRK